MRTFNALLTKQRIADFAKVMPVDPDRTEVLDFADELEKIVAEALGAMKRRLLTHLTDLITGNPTDVLDLTHLFAGLPELTRPLLAGMAVGGATEALEQLSIDSDVVVRIVRTNSEAWALERSAEMVGRKRVGGGWADNPNAKWAITDTTRDGIKALTKTAIREGWSTGELASNLEGAYTFSRTRAKMIARTEIGNADSQGAMIGYKASGVVVGKYWLTAEDEDVSDPCRLNSDAGAIPLDELFPSGDMQPLEHPNCRCVILPVLEGEMK